MEIVLTLLREHDFQGLRGGQFGRLFNVFSRGVFQEASGGVFFEILCDFGAQWGIHWEPCGVQMRGHFLGNFFMFFLGHPSLWDFVWAPLITIKNP